MNQETLNGSDADRKEGHAQHSSRLPPSGKTSKSFLMLLTAGGSLLFLLVVLLTYFQRADRIIESTQQGYETIDTIDNLLIELLEIESSLNNFFITGNVAQISGAEQEFEEDVDQVQNELEALYLEWEGFIVRADIVALKTDIQEVVSRLETVLQSSDRSLIDQRSAIDLAKQLVRDINDELNEIRASLLQKMKSNHLKNIDQFRNIKWWMLSLCAVSSSLVFFLFHSILRNDQLQKNLTEFLGKRNEELEARVQQRTQELEGLAAYLTRVNEEEKKRIASELHDELGALLTAANMDATWIARNLSEEDKDRFAKKLSRLSDNIKRGIKLKRDITTSLVPPLLRELGLAEALKDMAANVQALSPETTIELSLPSALPSMNSEQELALYRICQESLTNINKYAKADRVKICMSVAEKEITLRVEDNGIGFAPGSRGSHSHGLTSMHSRAAMFGGKLEVDSEPGKGTHVCVSMEIDSREASS